ncbi:MAG: hypothetical protein CSA32_00330 [Desulfobulbus propionicus]|nr:MAG: hypothetical protein CSA32_00330 [Desulfobulbus propionicus]
MTRCPVNAVLSYPAFSPYAVCPGSHGTTVQRGTGLRKDKKIRRNILTFQCGHDTRSSYRHKANETRVVLAL